MNFLEGNKLVFQAKGHPIIIVTAPLERMNIDFERPLLAAGKTSMMLNIVEELSQFSFASPEIYRNLSSPPVITCLTQLICLTRVLAYIHSDQGTSLLFQDVTWLLSKHGVASSHTASYSPKKRLD